MRKQLRNRSLESHATASQGTHLVGIKWRRVKWRGTSLLGRSSVVGSVYANLVWVIFLGVSIAFSLTQPCCAVPDEPSSEVVADSSTKNEAKAVIGKRDLIMVLGAGGTEEYETEFRELESKWRAVCKAAGVGYQVIGLPEGGIEPELGEGTKDQVEDAKSDRDSLLEKIQLAGANVEDPLWIVLMGHGTYSRGVAKFNLRGPDVTAAEINDALRMLSRPIVFLNLFSASGPFLNALSNENRTIVTATRSGEEKNYSRFARFFIESLAADTSDLDHDSQVSVLEAFLAASAMTRAFYDSEQRLMTEHALLDDNGDQLGTQADFFRGVRPVKKAKGGKSLDGRVSSRQNLAEGEADLSLTEIQRRQRNDYEVALDKLSDRKSQLAEAEYLKELENILIPLARLYESSATSEEDGSGD
ncbi:MAG: hypothetical protein VXZ38_11955 [Planctomycetota bacterium]|nr:hypothetical protein [Planctomycetota bacterium]